MEKFFYEFRPYFFLGLSMYALKGHSDSQLMIYSGFLLLGASLTVIQARFKHRGVIG